LGTWEIPFLVLDTIFDFDPSTVPSLNALRSDFTLNALRRLRSICHAFGVRIASYGWLRFQLQNPAQDRWGSVSGGASRLGIASGSHPPQFQQWSFCSRWRFELEGTTPD
jgi:hypothetical protein